MPYSTDQGAMLPQSYCLEGLWPGRINNSSLKAELRKNIDARIKPLEQREKQDSSDLALRYELFHYYALRSSVGRIAKLADNNLHISTLEKNQIEHKVLGEVVRSSYVGGALVLALGLLATAAAVAGILLVSGVVTVPAVATVLAAVALSNKLMIAICGVVAGFGTLIAVTGSIGMFSRATMTKKVLAGLDAPESNQEGTVFDRPLT